MNEQELRAALKRVRWHITRMTNKLPNMDPAAQVAMNKAIAIDKEQEAIILALLS
jgi:hypothetical protein